MPEGAAAATEIDYQKRWRDHCRDALGEFLINGVVIDNNPQLDEGPSSGAVPAPKTATAAAEPEDFASAGGSQDDEETETVAGKADASAPAEDGDVEKTDHPLNVRLLTDVFADAGKVCAFYFPDDDVIRADGEASVIERAAKIMRRADFAVIDWYLSGGADGGPETSAVTKSLLRKVLEDDRKENGRLRLVCIYTGAPEVQTASILSECQRIAEEAGFGDLKHDDRDLAVYTENLCITVLRKSPDHSSDMVNILLKRFALAVEGVLPAFVLRGIAAIRKNAHHLITRFPADLDAAYVANRLITDPQGDVAELMREIFVSECDTALGLEKVADQCLEKAIVRTWIRRKEWADSDLTINTDTKIDTKFIEKLLDNGFDPHKNVILVDGKEFKFPEEKRKRISEYLHDSKKEKSISAQRNFSMLSIMKREAFGASQISHSGDWAPSLTLGSIVYFYKSETGRDDVKKYLYCLTPACDMARLYGQERQFLFLELGVSTEKPTILLRDFEGELLKLRAEFRTERLRQIAFKGDEKVGRVLATRSNGEHFHFDEASGAARYLWLGEVRLGRAQRDLADFTKNWMRFGILEAEYLRLAGKNKAEL